MVVATCSHGNLGVKGNALHTHVCIDDFIQTRERQTANVVGGVATVTIPPPNLGTYWLVDRIVAETDVGATGTLVIYEQSALPENLVSGGVAQVGLGLIVGSFDPPIQVPPGVPLVLVVRGIVGLTAISVGYWYRLRKLVQRGKPPPPGIARTAPQPPQGVPSATPVSEGTDDIRRPEGPPMGYDDPEPLSPAGMREPENDPMYY